MMMKTQEQEISPESAWAPSCTLPACGLKKRNPAKSSCPYLAKMTPESRQIARRCLPGPENSEPRQNVLHLWRNASGTKPNVPVDAGGTSVSLPFKITEHQENLLFCKKKKVCSLRGSGLSSLVATCCSLSTRCAECGARCDNLEV